MPDYGWAYVNLDALNSVNGATGSITFRSSETDVSGTSAFIYATASHKVGLGINTPGATDGVVGALPSFILDVSASAGDTTAVRMVGDLQVSGSAHVSGTLTVDSLHTNTVISSSHLIVRDPIIGMGFGDSPGETGSVGDRGLILGLAGNNNQAIIWDQTSGSFVIGKVAAQGPDAAAFDIPDGNLSTVRVSDLTASNSVSASVFYGNGEHLTGISAGAVSAVANGADNRVATFSSATALNGEANLTFDGTDLGVSDKIFHVGDTDTFINFTTDDLNFQAGGVNFFDLTSGSASGLPDHEITFNEGGVDVDFRVETADESHMLFIEGSSNRMSIGDNTGSPGATLEIKNHASAGATGVPLLQLNNNDTDQQCVDINAGNIDANVVNITANDVTTARVLAIGADGLTTGNALYVDDNSSNTGTRNTALIIQNNAAAINAKALAIQSDGGKTGVKIDKNYSDTTEASVVGLDIDWDKTGASTSDNTMYGIQIDMDNTTATNGNNTMYGLHVTPTLTHAANAGTPIVYGALINAQGGTNGTSLVQGARIEAGGGDINYGIQLDVEDGGVDLRIESSADSGDYFQIQTTTHGATTITTVDDDATAANLTFTIDGDITLDPAGGDVFVDGNVSGSGTFQAVGVTTLGNNLLVSGTITAPNLGTDTDNTVVIVNSSGLLKTDEADSRIFGSTLVDGTGGAGQITLWNDSNTVQGSTSLREVTHWWEYGPAFRQQCYTCQNLVQVKSECPSLCSVSTTQVMRMAKNLLKRFSS
jgi:hypothetical protein